MKGISISFLDHNTPFEDSNIFVKGDGFDTVEESLKKAFNEYANKNDEYVSYFNWMNVDSDFADNHAHDAEISVFYTDKETNKERSTYYKMNFNVINTVI